MTTPTHPVPQTSNLPAWGHRIFQSAAATAFGSLIVAWMAIDASLGAATTGAVVMCLAVPIIGWFFGLPLVIGFGMIAAMAWFSVLFALLSAWAITATGVGIVAFARSR